MVGLLTLGVSRNRARRSAPVDAGGEPAAAGVVGVELGD
jgi:hypothetical protein